jgi:hypothetical protein
MNQLTRRIARPFDADLRSAREWSWNPELACDLEKNQKNQKAAIFLSR